MSIRELKLSKDQHQWLDGWLELWGAWIATCKIDKIQGSVIARCMAEVQLSKHNSRPICSDDDGILISQVVDSVMTVDKKALLILINYYGCNLSKRAIASYYHKAAKPRKIDKGRLGEGFRKPSEETCRKEIAQIIDASLYLLYQPMQNAFNSRKRVAKIQHVGDKWLDKLIPIYP